MKIALSIFRAVASLVILFANAESDHIGDTEPAVVWTPPTNETYFISSRVGANYSGLLYAGHHEFNWLVDIRTEDGDQESWSVGNLVTYYHVLTTHRAVAVLQEMSKSLKESSKPAGYVWSKDEYPEGSDIRVYYCQDYLWADGRRSYARLPTERDYSLTGYRSAKEILRHLSYTSHLLYDAAFIVMNRGIPPIPPRLGYMPTGFDYAEDKFKEQVKLDPSQDPSYSSPICYVASFGKNSVNNDEFYTLDYKVKYRVYITRWETCLQRWKYICPSGDASCKSPLTSKEALALMCLQPRAKVGTVCDHDKGAPLVCNGQVVGLVVRGAPFRYCNNVFKIPFVAEKIDNYRGFLDDSVSYLVKPVRKKKDQTKQGAKSLASTHPYNWITILSMSGLAVVELLSLW